MILEDFVQGIREGIPPCCVARFCLDLALGRTPGVERFSAELGSGWIVERRYVPCKVIHRDAPRTGSRGRIVCENCLGGARGVREGIFCQGCSKGVEECSCDHSGAERVLNPENKRS